MTDTSQADALLQALMSGVYGAMIEGFRAFVDDQKFDETLTLLLEGFAALTEAHEREKALHVLIALLTDPDPGLRLGAVKALGSLGDKRAIEFLRDRFEELVDSSWMCDALTNALVDLGDAEVIMLNLLLTWKTPRTFEILKRLNDEDVLRVMDTALTHPDEHIRSGAFHFLRNMETPGATPLFIRGLTHEDKETRSQAVGCLRRVPEAVSALLPLISDPESYVRWVLVRVLDNSDDPRVVPALLRLTADPSLNARWMLAQVLGRKGDRQAIPSLLLLLRDQDKDVQFQAAVALGKLGDASGVALLHRYVKRYHSTQLNCVNAVEALRTLGRPLVPMLIRLVKKQSLESLWDGEESVALIAEIFAEQGDAAALPALYKMHASQDKSKDEDDDGQVSTRLYLDRRVLISSVPSCSRRLMRSRGD